MFTSSSRRAGVLLSACLIFGALAPVPTLAQGVPIRLLTCPAGQVPVSVGDSGWVCGDPAGGHTSGDRIVFVTSQLYTGALGGPAGADLKCQQQAEAAGLPGRYRAWVSSPTREPNGHFDAPAGPYRRVDGMLVATDWIDLTTKKSTSTEFFLHAPINVDELGSFISGETRVWTATGVDGLGFLEACSSTGRAWRSAASGTRGWYGDANHTSTAWSEISTASCDTMMRLYCFQQ